MQNAGWMKAQTGIKIAGRNINNLRYADDNHPNGRKQRGTKELLDEGKVCLFIWYSGHLLFGQSNGLEEAKRLSLRDVWV